MKNYLKLVDFEMKRFWKIYAVLIGLLITVQSITVVMKSNSYKNRFEESYMPGMNYVDDYSVSFSGLTMSTAFMAPITLIISALVFNIFFTWYREWLGKNTFAYQLLLLPFNRMTIYFAKLTSLLLYIFGCLVIQIAMYPLLNTIFTSIVPQEIRIDQSLLLWLSPSLLGVLIPSNSVDFFTSYGVGIVAVSVIFTVIILERSFRLKGIGLGIAFIAFCIFLFVESFIIGENYLLYIQERVILQIVSLVMITVLSFMISYYIINKKISV